MAPLIPKQVTYNVDSELNKRSLSLSGPDYQKLLRLKHAVKGEKGKEVWNAGEVGFKKGYQLFGKLPLEVRRMIWYVSSSSLFASPLRDVGDSFGGAGVDALGVELSGDERLLT